MRIPALHKLKCHRFFVFAGLLALLVLPPVVRGWTIDLSAFENDPNSPRGMLALSSNNFAVRVPVSVQNMPVNWRESDLVVAFGAEFRSGGGNGPWIDLSGSTGNSEFPAGFSRGQVTRTGFLQNGSYDGVIAVPSNELYGVVTNDMVVISIAVARRGSECLMLGIGCYTEGSGECLEMPTSQFCVFECSDDDFAFRIPQCLSF